jgi:hypothetical protein
MHFWSEGSRRRTRQTKEELFRAAINVSAVRLLKEEEEREEEARDEERERERERERKREREREEKAPCYFQRLLFGCMSYSSRSRACIYAHRDIYLLWA